ncbi:hypothetical protein [uncultured Methanobrevibacter sp.]|uniref:hypothetical protein n=1 Tax=uncultured Methanobrevibacter sp. TaxID=253161 RepID=UPI0025E6A7C2|nr:hypothetical protein [uncultured Methanobrevibacter sp.]
MSKEIITLCVGQRHYGGTLKQGDVVELKLLEESDYENNIAVFNPDGVQCGSIINRRFDSDIVDGIYNNDMVIGFMEDYDWIVVKAYKSKSFLKAIPKAAKEVSEESIEAMECHVANLKASIHEMICALDDVGDDFLLEQHLRSQIESSITLHNELSNEVVRLQNELIVAQRTTRVFDYYSEQSAK